MLDAMVHDGSTKPFSGRHMFLEATEVGGSWICTLLLGQIALLCELPVINEPSAILSSIAFGILLARLGDTRRRKSKR
jgi:hypothetical protein